MSDAATPPSSRREIWRQAAVRTALVSGLFCAVLGGLLLANSMKLYRGAGDAKLRLVEARRLLPLKAELRENPLDEALVARIREIDLEVRENHFRRQHFASWGGKALLGGAVILLVSLHASLHLTPPRVRTPDFSRSAGSPGHRRRAIIGTTLVLGGMVLALVWGATPRWEDVALAAEEPTATAAARVDPALDPEHYPAPEEARRHWWRFRGPSGQGDVPYADIPSTWDGESGENILWKTEVPLPGENSPLVWGNRVFLTGATEERREVFCFDADTGALLWREPVSTAEGARAEPPEIMEETGHAASTAVTDGYRVVAMFANGEIGAFDYRGRRLWARFLGTPENLYGHATSLAMWRNVVIVLYDQGYPDDDLSQILGLNAATGKILWSTPRQVANSWASPIVVPGPEGDQVITSADPWVIAYDPADGSEIWRAGDVMSGDAAPSPAFARGRVYLANEGAYLAAIGLAGRGDVTESQVLWKWDEAALPDVCSLISDGPRVYMVVYGLLSAFDAETGAWAWEHDLSGDFQASPSLVDGELWFLDSGGTMIMGRPGAEGFEETGRAELGEDCGATPAFAPGRIYLRGRTHLWCIGRPPQNS